MSAASPPVAEPVTGKLSDDLRKVGHRLLAGAMGGFLCGLIIGGLGGRLAMFILRLTTGTDIAGLESDDGFTMGSFTSATLFLVGATSFFGGFLGVIYSIGRGWLPERVRAIATATFFGLAGGAAIIHPDGIDFTVLEPLSLAIAMFVLLPALFGFAMSKTVDRLLERPAGKILPWLGVALGAVFVVVAGVGGEEGSIVALILIIGIAGGLFISRKFPKLRSLPKMPAVVWTARVVLIAAGAFAAFYLVKDAIEVLS